MKSFLWLHNEGQFYPVVGLGEPMVTPEGTCLIVLEIEDMRLLRDLAHQTIEVAENDSENRKEGKQN